MRLRFCWLAAIAVSVLLLAGCVSNGSDPAGAIPDASAGNSLDSRESSRVLWGVWTCFLDLESGQIEAVPLRSASFTANVNQLLESKPGNLLIHDVDSTGLETEGRLDCTITLRHPLPGYDMYHGFDVWGVFMSNGSASMNYGGLWYSEGPIGNPDNPYLLNPDGFTRWFNTVEFWGHKMPIVEYYPGDLAAFLNPNASVNPFKIFADGLGTYDDYHEWITHPGNAADRGIFRAGMQNSRRYQLYFPYPTIQLFNYVIVANWEPGDPTLTGSPVVYDPGDFPTSANCDEAFFIDVSTVASDLYNDGGGNAGGTFRADIEVFDWQGGSVGELGVPSEVNRIIIEGDFLTGGSYEFTQAELVPLAVPATENSSVFQVEITNCAPQQSGESTFWLIVESAGLNGGSYGQGFPSKYPEDAKRAAFQRSSVDIGTETPSAPEGEWSEYELIDGQSRAPRAVINPAGEKVLIWDKQGVGIKFTWDQGAGWEPSNLAYTTAMPTYMHLVRGESGQTVYSSWKATDSGNRHAIRWTGGAGPWDYSLLHGTTEQPTLFLPDDDGTFTHPYTFTQTGVFEERLHMIEFDSWDGNWSSPPESTSEDRVRMSHCNCHERDGSYHYVAYRCEESGLDYARVIRISKTDLTDHTAFTIYEGASGESVDAPGLCRDNAGKLHAAWRVVDAGGDHRIDYARSTDNGQTWSGPVTVATGTYEIQEGHVAVDTDSNNVVYVTYIHFLYIYMVNSADGVNWNVPTSPYDDPTMPIGYHYTQPFPLITSDNILHVFFVFKDSIFDYGNVLEVLWVPE